MKSEGRSRSTSRKSRPGRDDIKPHRQPGNRELAAQTRKLLGKHYTNKYGVRKG
jgi:hypothetical protein